MNLLADVVAALRTVAIPHALIGAAAMSAHGIARATADVDLLITDAGGLLPATWAVLEGTATIDMRRGDDDDPLAGVVRFTRRGEIDVDVVVGKCIWQQACVQRALPSTIDRIPVVSPADLVLLKLYAGGPQDAWDIHQVLGLPDADALVALVDTRIAPLPDGARALWTRIIRERL